ncbi:MAG TPA: MgtC/SapB family protein [Bryobacteraceae bacterium]|nr:MgtC/SapB family protein [Bryobacteraceae bacterium]
MDLNQWLPPEAPKILLVLSLCFLIGLNREEHKAEGGQYAFGGVRTFPLIGLIGYALALLSEGQLMPVTLGFAVVGGFLIFSYRYKLSTPERAGVTSEMSGLLTYLIGALVYKEEYWIATTLSVAGILLLELKAGLESLTKRIAPDEVLTFTKFLLLTVVILPVLPNRAIGPFEINPFRTWLVVVAVSAISYGSYVISQITKGQGGILVAAILGGAYSSTVTTIVMARRAAREDRPHLFAGGTLIASGMMYLRLTVLLAIFNRHLFGLLWPSFAGLAALGLLVGWLWSRSPDSHSGAIRPEYQARNPLEFRAAFLFGLLFLAMVIVTHYALAYLGKAGLYSLAAVMGVVDVDPFILGMTQSTGANTPFTEAAAAILIAAASNNLVKGVYAYAFSDRKTGMQSLALLATLAVLGVIPLIWLAR